MRYLFVLPFLPFLAAPSVAEENPLVLAIDNPAYVDPADAWTDLQIAQSNDTSLEVSTSVTADPLKKSVCRDTIAQARAEAGLPPLQRETASPDNPQLIYAVDRRENGCAVMVMKGNPDDIRPLRDSDGRGPSFQPAKSDQ